MSDSLRVLREARLNILEAINIPHSLSVALCYKYEQYDELYRLLKEPETFLPGKSWLTENISNKRNILQVNALFSKADDLPAMEGLEEEALASFLQCEALNKETNIRFLTKGVPSNLIYTTSTVISGILGDFNKSEFESNLRFGPGVSSTCRGYASTIAHKLESDISCTPRALKHVEEAFSNSFQYYYALKSIVSTETHNIFLTIPKTFKERRGIAIGQHANIVLQLALGKCYRRRFRRYVNLNNAADLHRKLVKEEWSEIATIDLRKASQMISRRAVQAVWPQQWLDLMDDLREEYTLLPDGTLNYNQHYSAMGNGFTFEMESILFYAIAKAAMLNAGRKWKFLSVFGDDIIVDKENAEIVIDALESFGFVINKDKTFIDHCFKESCGEDTLYGHPVRPIYFRENYGRRNLEVLFALANNIIRIAANSGHRMCLDGAFYRSWISVIREIPESKRYFVSSSCYTAREETDSNCEQYVPGDDTVLYTFPGRKIPDGKWGWRLRRKYDKSVRYYPASGDIQLGSALLGMHPDGAIPRNHHAYKLVKQKLRYRTAPSTMVWTN